MGEERTESKDSVGDKPVCLCKKEEHWKRECPEWPGNKAAPVLVEKVD